jgi:hypothetical protein
MKLHILHTNTACNLANHPHKETLAKFGYKMRYKCSNI